MWCSVILLVFFNISLIFAQSFPLLLLVSFDGFRHDYPELHGPLKNFRRLQERGVRATKMIPTFATATFPNHYTLVTGLYEEVHGLISNEMFDPKLNITFDSSDNMTNAQWWPYPAIWSINEQRKNARSGVVGWPQNPIRISQYEAFRRTRSFRDIIDQILRWFDDPVEPINFGAIYNFEPDLTGHRTGPYSKNMTETVRQCDEHLGYLLDRIDANKKLRDNLHLIVTSDHGMEQINGTTTPAYLEDYVDMNKIKASGIPTVMSIFVLSPNDMDIVLKNLSRIAHSRSYRRKDIPERYHYRNHSRIGDILIVCDAGYEIHRRPSGGKKTYDLRLIHGNHGYDNQADSMKTIFYASGPKFKRNFTLDQSSSLYNVDLFGLMCGILDIKQCPPFNGSLKNTRPFLVSPNGSRSVLDLVIYSLALFAFALLVIMGIVWSVASFRNISIMRKELRTSLAKDAKHSEIAFSEIKNSNITAPVAEEQV